MTQTPLEKRQAQGEEERTSEERLTKSWELTSSRFSKLGHILVSNFYHQKDKQLHSWNDLFLSQYQLCPNQKEWQKIQTHK